MRCSDKFKGIPYLRPWLILEPNQSSYFTHLPKYLFHDWCFSQIVLTNKMNSLKTSTYSCIQINRKSQLWDEKIGTNDFTFKTKKSVRLASYSYVVMIVTWKWQITKVGPTTSQRSTTCQQKTGFLMPYLCWFFTVNTAFNNLPWLLIFTVKTALNNRKWSIILAQGQETTHKD